ncbi:MAG TPA: ATP-binding cassette domain-containing protein [Chloroflexota bacterium]|nr:ATP-binding cassette domain-containing protein [Chloroflexota bacterium]
MEIAPSSVPRGAPLISVRDLRTYFTIGSGGLFGVQAVVKAVDGLSFDIYKGETLGLVGESGCGKSTTGRTILQLIRATSGQVLYDGRDLCRLGDGEMRRMRRRLQIIFQDPYASLSSRMRVETIIGDALAIHGLASGRERRAMVRNLLQTVGLDPAYAQRYPHEFSGGQRQRIGIARALALRPDVLIADEPVSALDVSIQRQILELLVEIRERMHLTMLFITHDLRVAAQLCDSIAVMRRGEIVEYGAADLVLTRPQSDYTRALVAAVPGKAWDLARAAADRPAIHVP